MLFSDDARACCLAIANGFRLPLTDAAIARAYLRRMGWGVDRMTFPDLAAILARAIAYRAALAKAGVK